MQSGYLNVELAWHGEPQQDLAREEQLIDLAAEDQASLLIYSWPDPVLVLGYGQRIEDSIWDVARSANIPIYRRHTGGTGVLQHRDLNISLVLPVDHPWSRGIGPLYDKFAKSIARALDELGIQTELSKIPVKSASKRSHICFEDHAIETLLYQGKKALGCAQGRRRGGVMVHGTLITGQFDPRLQAEIFQVTEERISSAIGSLQVPKEQHQDLIKGIVRSISFDLNLEPQFQADHTEVR